ncbi:hypothetical protein LSTR_LSTR013126 [Laodelphax striatellus]|uniref:Uncharacterized protein n=1 Tax=Laodelphax striatellus TaxID=195883 RepID=A0A482XGC7_LAOST|nr:hypothetical protein LSTR_LSTR017649 [Laodelphax striatellus]RZF44936.1 hypothetical protein LSTR_LSTR013126 [Laodelphax striatellus]
MFYFEKKDVCEPERSLALRCMLNLKLEFVSSGGSESKKEIHLLFNEPTPPPSSLPLLTFNLSLFAQEHTLSSTLLLLWDPTLSFHSQFPINCRWNIFPQGTAGVIIFQ